MRSHLLGTLSKPFVLAILVLLSYGQIVSAGLVIDPKPSADPPSSARLTVYLGVMSDHPHAEVFPMTVLTGKLSDAGVDDVTLALYCVDLLTPVTVSSMTGANLNATVGNDGKVDGVRSLVVVPDILTPNAGKIVDLLLRYGATATTFDKRMALQAAIWELEYGASFALVAPGTTLLNVASVTTPGTQAAYDGILSETNNFANLTNKPLDLAFWISPTKKNTSNTVQQGFVALNPNREYIESTPVPEPSSLLVMFGVGTIFLIRRFRLHDPRQ